jgi:uncharacterized protein (DUF362 family)
LAKVYVDDAGDIVPALQRCVAAVGQQLALRPGQHVFLKPNLTYPRHKPGVTTSPNFIRAAIQVFTEMGAKVTVGEGDGGYGSYSADIAFEGHGLREICRRYGADLVNLSTAPAVEIDVAHHGIRRQIKLPALLLNDATTFITLPVPKIHAVTTYSGAVKNQWGCIPDPMRLRLHPLFQELIWQVNQLVRPRLVLADAQHILDRSGPLTGEPIYMNRVVASDDILACDVAIATRLMGLDSARISYLLGGKTAGYSWDADDFIDVSTGPRHKFVLRRTLRHRMVAAAFPHQWAVDLLWFSPLGDLAHRLMYAVQGNEVAIERSQVEQQTREAHGPSSRG